MPWYMTQYPPIPTMPNSDGATVIGYFGTYLHARHRAEAESFVLARNIGEQIIGPSGAKTRPEPALSDLLRKRRLTPRDKLHVMHAATFLAYLVMQSLATPPHEVVGDEGFLHHVVHTMLYGTPTREHVIATVRYFERRVPGYLNTKRDGV
jgi:hypothetical protein